MTSVSSPIPIDGAHGEGGGGLVRAALVMSSLTLQPVRIANIRGATNHPGLDFEDLTLLRALQAATGAEVEGAEAGSLELVFAPRQRPRGLRGPLDLPGETARRNPNALVVLNALLPLLARTGMYSSVSLKGETYGHHALTFDYFASVTIPALAKLGLVAFPEMERAGFGREAAGEVAVEVEPSALHGVDWSERGKLIGCRGLVVTSEIPPAIGQRGASHLERLSSHLKLGMETETAIVDSANPGAFVTVWAIYERGFAGATAMGSRGVRVETLAQTAFEELASWMSTDATVDPFLADMILIPAALADGPSVFKVSELTRRFLTTVWVVKQFLPIHITVRGTEGSAGTVSVRR